MIYSSGLRLFVYSRTRSTGFVYRERVRDAVEEREREREREREAESERERERERERG